MINKRQPRTLGEVNQQVQSSQTTFSLDAEMFRRSAEKLFNWVWDLWCQYGDDEYEFSYFGKEGYEKIKLNREEIQGKYKITVRGNDQNTNPQVRIQKAEVILGMMENPILMQAGVVTPINVANALKVALQEMDIPEWEKLITMPPPPQPQQAPPPPVKLDMVDMTPAQAEFIKQKYGIPPDIQGAALMHQEEGMATEVEHEHKLIQEKAGHRHAMEEQHLSHLHEIDKIQKTPKKESASANK
jgi:hypothetical protein